MGMPRTVRCAGPWWVVESWASIRDRLSPDGALLSHWKFVRSCGLRHHRDGGRPSARCSVKPHLQRHSANHRASSSGRRQSGEGFFARNPQSALKLGQARGVALLAAAENQLDVYEYSSNEIKSAVVGYGHATKEQVQNGRVAAPCFGEDSRRCRRCFRSAVCQRSSAGIARRIMEAAPKWQPAMRRRRFALSVSSDGGKSIPREIQDHCDCAIAVLWRRRLQEKSLSMSEEWAIRYSSRSMFFIGCRRSVAPSGLYIHTHLRKMRSAFRLSSSRRKAGFLAA